MVLISAEAKWTMPVEKGKCIIRMGLMIADQAFHHTLTYELKFPSQSLEKKKQFSC